MKKFFALAVISGILAVGGSAEAGIIKFDDITTNAIKCLSWDSNNDPYGREHEHEGFMWKNFGVLDSTRSSDETHGYGYAKANESGNYVAFNVCQQDLMLSWLGNDTNDTFNFNSAFLTAAKTDPLDITVTGTNSDSGHSQSLLCTLHTDYRTKIYFNFKNIDTLTFSAGGDKNFAMDNFTFNEPVPEPATLLLFGTGMAGLFAVRRKTLNL
ncbi:MAG: PEP-CTERM sorting domain-containing protein [Thermodesulfobacteriota bacterium]|nr:PEP-CTERM sorting domain-containing protein [Thermodesulfobacteriota bacterium]